MAHPGSTSCRLPVPNRQATRLPRPGSLLSSAHLVKHGGHASGSCKAGKSTLDHLGLLCRLQSRQPRLPVRPAGAGSAAPWSLPPPGASPAPQPAILALNFLNSKRCLPQGFDQGKCLCCKQTLTASLDIASNAHVLHWLRTVLLHLQCCTCHAANTRGTARSVSPRVSVSLC